MDFNSGLNEFTFLDLGKFYRDGVAAMRPAFDSHDEIGVGHGQDL